VASESDQRRRIELTGVFDIETENWDRFLCGGLYLADGTYIERTWRGEENLADRILATSGTLWAHAGGRLDFSWLLGHAVSRGMRVQVQLAGSRVVYARIGADLTLCDSFALVPISLARLTEGMSVEKAPYPLPCLTPEHGALCKGFCRFKRGMASDDLRRVLTYLRGDCVSLFAALAHLQEWADGNDLDLGPTIGGSAWKNAQRTLGLPSCQLTHRQARFTRMAYFGGRTQVFRPEVALAHEADVVSMYPHALDRLEVPLGDPRRIYGSAAARSFERGDCGVYAATIHQPDTFCPVLPVRASLKDDRGRAGTPRVCYPTGVLRGVWTGLELRHAVERGAAVLSVRAGLSWPLTVNVFSPWVQRLFTLRAASGKNTPVGKFLKLYANSLTGKLGQRPEGRSLYTTEDGKPKDIRRHKPVGPFYECKTYFLHACSHPEWASLLTSFSRVKWHRMATLKGEDIVYGDTDSVFTLEPRENLGSELGDFEGKGIAANFRCIAPKFYAFERGGTTVIRSKGIRQPTLAEFDHLTTAGVARFSWGSVRGLSGAARHGGHQLLQGVEISRSVTRGTGDRVLDVDASGNLYTRPPRMVDLAAA